MVQNYCANKSKTNHMRNNAVSGYQMVQQQQQPMSIKPGFRFKV